MAQGAVPSSVPSAQGLRGLTLQHMSPAAQFPLPAASDTFTSRAPQALHWPLQTHLGSCRVVLAAFLPCQISLSYKNKVRALQTS